MWPPSSPSKHAVLSLNSTRLSRRRHRRVRPALQLEGLEDRQLLSGQGSGLVVPTTSFIKQDVTTRGTWIGTHGFQGYDVIGKAASLPSYDTVTPAGTGELHLGRELDRPGGAPECQRLRTDWRLVGTGPQFQCRSEADRRSDA